MMRYEHSGQRPDLENAISLYRQAHVLFRDSDPERAPILMNMAHSLVTSFRKFNELRDLEEGLSHYRSALEISDSAVRPVCLSNLANALRVRFHETGQLSDVDEATGYYREALHLCSPQHPDRNMYLINFGTTLLSRFLRTTEEADLDEAIRHLEEAEDDLPAHDPLHALSQFNLGTASWNKYQIARDETELRRALALLESAARLPFSSAKARFEAALQWSVISHSQQHPSTIQAYSCALDLLEKWVIVNPAIEAQHRFLATDQSQNLACDGASAAIDRGDLEAAVELLEHGRTVLWSRLQGYRQTLDELRIKDSGLVDRFESLSKELEDLSLRSEAKITPLLDPVSRVSDDTMKTQRILSEQWEEVVSQIRRTEGFAHFLQPTPFSVLQQASSEGPVILVNLSRFRSDAVVILVDRAPILVPLPNATPETMFHLYTQLDAGLKSRDGVSGGTSQLVSTVRLLWVNVVQPVVSQLQALGVPERSRIWWCPTSYMCGLPLHAAGSYSRSNPQPSFCDLFVSSYTPTLAALLRARNSTPRVAAPEILVVGQPGRDLPSVEQEIQEVVRLGPFVRTLLGEDASRDRVATSLEEYPWVHFACHAKQDPLPFQSSFELYDGQLTLLDLVRSHRVGGGLAFLSACNTATGDSETPNENLHLAAALQFSGFQSVVGTLWPMADSDGPAIAREFYQHLFQMGQDRANARDSAVALSYATKYLRRSGVPLDRWINFVHIGA
ncbi:CHAT domain-containing protein [Mycena vulgaris]|nr:CHAT domain-containing protein [Mycena vulgaris]